MILGTTCIALIAVQQQMSLEQGAILARSFAERARLGAYGQVAGTNSPLALVGSKVLPSGRYAAYSFAADVGVRLDLRTGRVTIFNDRFGGLDVEWRENEALRYEQLMGLAQELYSAAGYPDALVHYVTHSHGSGGTEGSFTLHMLPSYQGVPYSYEWAVLLTVEHVSGRLYNLQLLNPDRPSPPQSLVPGVSTDVARASMMHKIFELRPGITTLFEDAPVRLAIWSPGNVSRYQFRNLAPSQVQAGSENKGILVYWAWFQAERYGRNERYPAYGVFSDAATGEVLAIEALEVGWGARGSARRVPFGWDLVDTTFVVSALGKSIQIPSSTIRNESAPTRWDNCLDLVLTFGRVSLRCEFDKRTGLLRTRRDGLSSFGSPGRELRDALMRLAERKQP